MDAVFDGVNGCVLAYGQTGAGKTYTVVGEDVDVIRGTEQGAGKKFKPILDDIISRFNL